MVLADLAADRCGPPPTCRVPPAARGRRRRGETIRAMSRSALITGITGQDGGYLAQHLIAQGYEVHGLIRGQNNPRAAVVRRLVPELRLIDGDLHDQSSLIAALEATHPDEVYNLAAISFVALSFKQAINTGEITGAGGHPDAGRDPPGQPGDPFLPGVQQRDVREGAGDAAERADRVPPPLPLRGGQGLRAPHHRQLPGELRAVRGERHPLQPRVAAPRPRVRDPQDHRRGGPDQAGARVGAAPRQPRRPAGLGVRRRLRARDAPHAAAGRARTITWSRPGRPTRCASSSSSPSATSGCAGRTTWSSTSDSSAPPRSPSWWGTPPRRAACSGGSRP